MKIPAVCAECLKDDPSRALQIGAVEFRDDGRYEITCPREHRSITILQQQRFEILFDIGAYAIVDGYYREAVSSFTASLERLYESFIRAAMHERNIDAATIDSAWKEVGPRSERQLGAFVIAYTVECGRPPETLSNASQKFRNRVIHEGKIPTHMRRSSTVRQCEPRSAHHGGSPTALP